MFDSAHLNEESVRRKNRKLQRQRTFKKPIEPLYTTEDALYTLDFFGRRATL